MKPRAILLTVVAFLVGALAAGSIGVRVIREVGTAEDATSLPDPSTTTSSVVVAPDEFQVDPYESVMSSTALIPLGVSIVDDEFAIEYELRTLAPHLGVESITLPQGFGRTITIEPEDHDHIWPRTWLVETGTEVFEGTVSSPEARVARVEVDDGFSPSEIRSVTVTEALAPYHVAIPFTLSSSEPSVEVYPGVTMELRGVSDQGSSSIVLVEVRSDDPNIAGFFVRGDGPGWRSAVWQAEGAHVVNLTWVGGELPEDIPLVAEGGLWVEVDGPFDVTLDGVS